jgi:hypothetical protein
METDDGYYIVSSGAWGGGVWFAAWLFTIGFLHLNFWRGVLAIVIWPYYLGAFFARYFIARSNN